MHHVVDQLAPTPYVVPVGPHSEATPYVVPVGPQDEASGRPHTGVLSGELGTRV